MRRGDLETLRVIELIPDLAPAEAAANTARERCLAADYIAAAASLEGPYMGHDTVARARDLDAAREARGQAAWHQAAADAWDSWGTGQ